MTLLAIDVGNTNVVFGVGNLGKPIEQWRATTQVKRTGDEWLIALTSFIGQSHRQVTDISGVVIGSVVPEITTALRRMCERLALEPLIVNHDNAGGLMIKLDDPREIGADRIANAVAAKEMVNARVIVVDMGTATTLDVIDADGAYVGGVIMPGIEISLDALFSRAAALRSIELVVPRSVVGHGTKTAIQSGATYGYAAQIDGLCEMIEKELGPCRVISTGGLSGIVTPLSQRIEQYDPALTLRGLQIIYQRMSQ